MGKYLLRTDLLIDPTNSTIANAGQTIELSDKEQIKALLDRGTIVEAGSEDATPTLSAFEAAQAETAARTATELGDQIVSGPPADEDTQEDGVSSQEQLTPPQPTPEQLEQDFQGAGASDSSSTPQLQ